LDPPAKRKAPHIYNMGALDVFLNQNLTFRRE
jgi:hypothetical protein